VLSAVLSIWVLLAANFAVATPVVLFSPKGGCETAIVKLIAETKSQLDIAVYSINDEAIINALIDARRRGVKIRILTDHVQAAVNTKTTLDFVNRGFSIRLHSSGKIMHNKFAVSDGRFAETGSFNWTNPAEQVNEENCLMLDDSATVMKYEERFERHLWVVNTQAKSEKYLVRLKKRATERGFYTAPPLAR
jgi:phosphatidylserine/phosphatidylglycerophosphate/cardiolipin synthase-like enzyme